MKKIVFSCVLISFLVLRSVSAAIIPDVDVDWSHTFLLKDLTTNEPLIRLGFYPPDPVIPSILDLSNPAQPMLSYPASDPEAHIDFAVSHPSMPLAISASGVPDNGHYEFQVLDVVNNNALMYSIMLDMTTSSGGVPNPGSWTMFNPQPEPPRLLGDPVSIGFNFQFTTLSDAYLTMQVLDAQGQPVSFSAVPDPALLCLLTAGFLLVFVRKNNFSV